MKTTEYLYGIKPEELEGMEYFSALRYKYNHGIALYQSLYLKQGKTEDEEVRMFHVEKAVRHTKRLMDEKTESGIYHYHGDYKPKVHEYESENPSSNTLWRWFRELLKR